MNQFIKNQDMESLAIYIIYFNIFSLEETLKCNDSLTITKNTLGFYENLARDTLFETLKLIIQGMTNDLQTLKFITPISISCKYLSQHSKLLTNVEKTESQNGFVFSLKRLSNSILNKQQSCSFGNDFFFPADIESKMIKGVKWINSLFFKSHKPENFLQCQMNEIQKCADITLFWDINSQCYLMLQYKNEYDFLRDKLHCFMSRKEKLEFEKSSTKLDFNLKLRSNATRIIMESKILNVPSVKQLIVLDALNICMAFGQHKLFACSGLKIAINYFKRMNCKVIAIIPEFYLKYNHKKKPIKKKKSKSFSFKKYKILKPDSVELLRRLREEKIIYTTPDGDYDDSYMIEFSRNHNGIIVSNDRYNDSYKTRTARFKCCNKLMNSKSYSSYDIKVNPFIQIHLLRSLRYQERRV